MTDNGVWWNCYNDQWGDELVPEAFSHPAKVAPGLSKRIYDHALELGWLSVGDMVLDPFGGIAGFGLQAMAHGCNWFGVELEQKFVDLGNQNLDLWRKRYALWPKFGSGILLQGDSRNLLAVVEAGRVVGCVSSPPYSDSLTQGNNPDTYSETYLAHNGGGQLRYPFQYGSTPGQLGASSNGDFWQAARIIVTQTYAAIRPGGHAIWVVKSFVRNKQIMDFPGQWQRLCESCGFVTLHEHHTMLVAQEQQLAFDGNHKRKERKSFFRRLAENKGSPRIDFEVVLCQVKPDGTEGFASCVVSSPPYSESEGSPSLGSVNKDNWGYDGRSITSRRGLSASYGSTLGNLGNMKASNLDAALIHSGHDVPR